MIDVKFFSLLAAKAVSAGSTSLTQLVREMNEPRAAGSTLQQWEQTRAEACPAFDPTEPAGLNP